MHIRTIERHQNGVKIIVENDDTPPVRESFIITTPECIEINRRPGGRVYKQAAVDAIKQAATDYLARREPLTMSERFRVLLFEATRRMSQDEEDLVTVAKGAEPCVGTAPLPWTSSETHSLFWKYTGRYTAAHNMWRQVIVMSDLVQDNYNSYEEIQRACDPKTKPLVDAADYDLDEE